MVMLLAGLDGALIMEGTDRALRKDESYMTNLLLTNLDRRMALQAGSNFPCRRSGKVSGTEGCFFGRSQNWGDEFNFQPPGLLLILSLPYGAPRTSCGPSPPLLGRFRGGSQRVGVAERGRLTLHKGGEIQRLSRIVSSVPLL